VIHLVREAAGEPEGTLVLLHGRGVDERDLFPLLDVFDSRRRLTGITVGAPLRLPPGPGKHWYVVERVGFPDPETFQATYAELTRFLDEELALDWSRTVIGGFSMGAVMSYAVGLGPERPVPAGVLATSGFIPTVEGWEPDLESRPHLPVAIAHGSADPVISVEFARAARDRLQAPGLPVLYRESDGMGHTIDPRMVPELAEWVQARVHAPA
jgi:phospholipase/carboxylesterase